ncbi:MAG: RNA 2',3'-cyclic phosphodiesterase [Acidobacteriota bacterium]
MRLFTAIDLPPEIVERLGGQIALWKPHARLRWSPVENLHITTKFIGEWQPERLGELLAALEAVPGAAVGAGAAAIPITLRGLGWFPNPHSPRIFWVNVQGGEALRALAAATEAALAPLGIPVEKKTYTPHLTLARVPPGSDIAELRRQVAQLPQANWGSFEAKAFHLYESRPEPGGSVYSRLHTISL